MYFCTIEGVFYPFCIKNRSLLRISEFLAQTAKATKKEQTQCINILLSLLFFRSASKIIQSYAVVGAVAQNAL